MKHFNLRLVIIVVLLTSSFLGNAQRRHETVDTLLNDLSSGTAGSYNEHNYKIVRVTFNHLANKLELKNPPRYVGEGGNIKIIIEDVNPFIYNVTIKELQNTFLSQDKLSETENTTGFSMLNFDMKDLWLNVATLHPPNTVFSTVVKAYSDSIRKIERTIERKKISVDSIYAIQQLRRSQFANDSLFEVDGITRTARVDIANAQADLQKLQADYEQVKIAAAAEATSSNNISDRVLQYNQLVTTFSESLLRLNDIVSFYRSLLNQIQVNGSTIAELKAMKRQLLLRYFPDLKDSIEISPYLNDLLNRTQADYTRLTRYYNDAANFLTGADRQNLVTNFAEVRSVFRQMQFDEFARFIDYVSKIYTSINDANFTVVHHCNDVGEDADKIYFAIQLTPLSGLDRSIPVRNINMSFSLMVRGGVKLDLSPGILFNVGLFDKTYRYKATSTTEMYTVEKNKERNVFTPTVAVMLHLYRRNSIRSHRPNFCFGVGTADAQRLRYYAGGSWIVGRKQRFNFCAGFVGGQVNHADESVLDGPVKRTPEQLAAPVPLRNPAPFQVGGFLGFTFNLTGNNTTLFQKLGISQ